MLNFCTTKSSLWLAELKIGSGKMLETQIVIYSNFRQLYFFMGKLEMVILLFYIII